MEGKTTSVGGEARKSCDPIEIKTSESARDMIHCRVDTHGQAEEEILPRLLPGG
jgi:hypothetical protein